MARESRDVWARRAAPWSKSGLAREVFAAREGDEAGEAHLVAPVPGIAKRATARVGAGEARGDVRRSGAGGGRA